MQTFLQQVAIDIHSRYKGQLANVCIVFPNRRAGLFFRKYLAEILTEPVWSPEIITINDFFLQYSRLQTADQLTLLFELYNTWKSIVAKDESFDRFYYWGEILLRDFDDIDKYLANADEIFQVIQHQKNLDEQFQFLDDEQKEVLKQFWNSINTNEPSFQQKAFIKVWEVLAQVYRQFKNSLISKNLAYEGMNYREVINRIENNNIVVDYHKIIFVGLNALSKCEEKLFDFLCEKKLAEFYWDGDDYYIYDKYNEAGYFLNKNLKRYSAFSKKLFVNHLLDHSLKDLKKETDALNIQVIGVPLEVGQAKAVGEVLQNSNYIPEHTAVVLPDEQLLFPVMHAIPDSIKQMNVTMGYPFKDTRLYSFIESLIELQQTSRKSDSSLQFYHRSLIAILKHSYFTSHNASLSHSIVEQIEKQNSIYVSIDSQWLRDSFIQKICKPVYHANEVSRHILEITDYVYSLSNKQEYGEQSTEQEYVYHFTLNLKRLGEIITHNKVDIGIDTFYKLLKKLIQQLRIPFAGEPLEGLQIMGLMETRCLDFENIFILSMNEGILPSKPSQASFIPYNIRKAYHLPISDHQDAIFAYYFYRSIQRAKNIYILYNTEADDAMSGEMSRYLYQLKYESGFANIQFTILNRQIKSSAQKGITIPSDATIAEKLKKYIVSEQQKISVLSPSAINTWLDCRLKFYFKYVAGLYEKDEVSEQLDAAGFGNILHRTMEMLYKPYENKMVTIEVIDSLKKNIEETIILSFNEYYGKNTSPLWGEDGSGAGRNIIVKDVIEEYILGILKKDAAYAPFEILGVEVGSEPDKLYSDFSCTISGIEQKIRIGGKIDRVDKKDNVVRILDYKTGSDSKIIAGIPSLFDREHPKRNKAAFQTILYSLLYQAKYAAANTIEPGLLNVKEMFSDTFNSRFMLDKEPLRNIDTISNEYQQHLQQLLQDIFSGEKQFEQTQDMMKCKYCAYASICNRE